MSFKSYKIELKLNRQQELLCAKSAGTARFAYNWMLDKLIREYEANKSLATMYDLKKVPSTLVNAIQWHKEWVLLKEQLPWIRETSKCCGQEALRNLERAFKLFFKNGKGYPKFKKRGTRDSFRLEGTVKVAHSYIQLPTFGKVRLKEKGYAVKEGVVSISQATVSRVADRWFVSFSIETGEEDKPLPTTIETEDIVGIDLGLKELCITSSGEEFENPRAYRKHLRKLKRASRQLSRKKKGSNNKKKARLKLAHVHMRVSNIRKDVTHKLTTALVKAKPKVIVMETLRPKNMSKNHTLAGSIVDASFGMIKEQLEYKCRREGILLLKAPTFYASSKFCSCCGRKYKQLQLTERSWKCSHCNSEHDRDVNAARNLKYLGEWLLDLLETATTESSSGCDACGDERLQFLLEQCSSMKQEIKDMLNSALHSFA